MSQHGSLQNQMLAGAKPALPIVGQKVTQILWTDRVPYQIVRVSESGFKFWMKPLKYTHRPHPESTCDVTDEVIETAPETEVKRRPNGQYHSNQGTVWMGGAQAYYDAGF